MKRPLKMLKRTVTMLFLHSSAASLVLAVLAVMGLAGPVAAGEQVRFYGSFAGVATVTGGPEILTVRVGATGNATDFGQFTLAIPHNVARGIPPFPFYWTSFGSYMFEAANGDELYASFYGLVNPAETPGVLAVVEFATIRAGTGQFAGATGTFKVERLVYPATLTAPRTTIGSFDGTISFPGAAGG